MERFARVDFKKPQFYTYDFTPRFQELRGITKQSKGDTTAYLQIIYSDLDEIKNIPVAHEEARYFAATYRLELYGAGTISEFIGSKTAHELVHAIVTSKRIQHLQFQLASEWEALKGMRTTQGVLLDVQRQVDEGVDEALMNLEVTIRDLANSTKT